jgi:hypothetical protein
MEMLAEMRADQKTMPEEMKTNQAKMDDNREADRGERKAEKKS